MSIHAYFSTPANRSVAKFLAASLVLAMGFALPAKSQDDDCKMADVSFITGGQDQVLNLILHEREVETPKGLFSIKELPPLGGVFAIYGGDPRSNRPLANSNVLAADLMTFDTEGRVLALMQDDTGPALDRMDSGDGLQFAAYLAGGTIATMGFDATTLYKGWRCTD